MTMRLDTAELENVRDVANTIADVLAPTVARCLAAAPPARDYRKEVWLAGAMHPQTWIERVDFADKLLKEFDKRFPK